MKEILAKICVLLIRLYYRVCCLFPVQRKIIFVSRQKDTPSEDFLLLREELGKRTDAKMLFLCKKLGGNGGHTIGFALHLFRQLYHVATSRVVIIDGYCIAVSAVHLREQTKVIQLWHASMAVKQYGWMTVDKPSGHSRKLAEIMGMHRNYDAVIAPSMKAGETLKGGMRVSDDTIVPIGEPHFSVLAASDGSAAQKIRETFHLPEDKKIVLYLPTFRPGNTTPQYRELTAAIDTDRFTLVLRPHPLEQLDEVPAGAMTDHTFSTYDWMEAADIIILDYSSLLIEAVYLKKEIYFYHFDIDTYADDPGLVFDFDKEGLGDYSFRTAEELAARLTQPYDAAPLAAFRDTYITMDAAHACERNADLVLSCLS